MIEPEKRGSFHGKIGSYLLETTPEEKLDKKIFQIVNHFNLARDLISNREGKTKLAKLNMKAGKKAKASAAYGPSLNYFDSGIAFLCENSWETDCDTTISMHVEAAEA